MKLFLILLSFLFLSFTPVQSVYVCHSKYSVAYHKYEDCKGLRRCTHKIVYLSVEEAVKMKKRACKMCY